MKIQTKDADKMHITHLLTARFSSMGTVLTNVTIWTPAPRVILMADVEGRKALASTGTDSTLVHSQRALTGLLWILQA